jgi:hypothetical protein
VGWGGNNSLSHPGLKSSLAELEEKVAEEVVLVKRECENKGKPEDCEWWKSEGYCADDSEFHDAMLDECPCSCAGENGMHTEMRDLGPFWPCA